MKYLFESIDITERAVAKLRGYFRSLPLICVQHWDCAAPQSMNTTLVQLHPDETLLRDATLRLQTAKMIARAWGGTWSQDGSKWKGRRPNHEAPLGLGYDEMILHDVVAVVPVTPLDLTPEPIEQEERHECGA